MKNHIHSEPGFFVETSSPTTGRNHGKEKSHLSFHNSNKQTSLSSPNTLLPALSQHLDLLKNPRKNIEIAEIISKVLLEKSNLINKYLKQNEEQHLLSTSHLLSSPPAFSKFSLQIDAPKPYFVLLARRIASSSSFSVCRCLWWWVFWGFNQKKAMT